MGDQRSRKKSKPIHATEFKDGSNDNGSVKAQKRPRETSSQRTSFSLSTYLWISGFLGALALAFFKPTVITELVGFWIGFSDHYDVVESQATVPEPRKYLPPDHDKRDAVVRAFQHSWHAYERNAMGSDEYHPLSQNGSNLTEAGSIGYMVVDVLDALQIMGLDQEYSRARAWVANLSFDKDGEYSTFETTIRVLGGLLSAYHLSGGDQMYLDKALDLADRLSAAFADSPSGLPYPYVNLHERKGYHSKDDYAGLVSVSEVGTLQLEFKYLSYLTDDPTYWRYVERTMSVLKDALLHHNLASVFLNHLEGRYITSAVSLGSRADSYYEYLLKQYIQTNKTEEVYAKMYRSAMDSIQDYLVSESKGNGFKYTSEMLPEQNESGEISWRLTPKQDHLVCFLGGSLMLGAVQSAAFVDLPSIPPEEKEINDHGWKDWKTGKELIKTCMKTHDTATGLAPEIVYFRIASDGMDAYEFAPADWYIRGAVAEPGVPPAYDARYMLRPETVESLFIAYRLTGDEIYREHGWKIFQAIEKHARVPTGGYATVLNVDENPARLEDKMETFFLSETLKYLYLLFSDSDLLPFDKYVFNTEAHPLPIFKPQFITGFS